MNIIKTAVFIVVLACISNVYAIRINEVESNPTATDAGNEWVELYSSQEFSLEGYKLVNKDGQEINLSESFQGYFIYIFEKQWLDNVDEKVSLYKGGELIDETEIFSDSTNDDKTWQYCNSWTFIKETREKENLCSNTNNNENANNETNQSGQNETIHDNNPQEKTNTTNNEGSNSKDLGTTTDKKSSTMQAQQKSNEKVLNQETTAKKEENNIIRLNTQAIKTEDAPSNLKNHLAMYGLFGFLILISILVFFKRKRVEELQ